MRTLWSELAAVSDARADRPRVYADANIPAGVVTFMRQSLVWDVFFVIEHADLRRAADIEHFRLARQLRRTLVTLDRDYLDDRRFPPGETAGILVLSAPDERGLERLLQRLDAELFHRADAPPSALPLEGVKVQAYPALGQEAVP
jgi:predicted nuclease of predicted toxin-antitoxin system